MDDQQAESVDEAQNEEQFRKASAKVFIDLTTSKICPFPYPFQMNNSKEETKNPQSRPKAILNKKVTLIMTSHNKTLILNTLPEGSR